MSRHGISRPAGSEPLRRNPPPHDMWRKDAYTGVLELKLQTPPGMALAPGTGRLVLRGEGAAAQVVEAASFRGGVPVVPGSSLKGAARTLYELLSHSCDPHPPGRKTPRPCQTALKKEVFKDRFYCEACGLFGAMGLAGRVSFSDAEPWEEGAVEIQVRKTPVPWEPHREETPGEFRFYDHGDAGNFVGNPKQWQLAEKKISRETYQGTFKAKMRFSNLLDEELGRLLYCLGVSPRAEEAFLFRVGGVRYDGYGGVRVRPAALRLARPRRVVLGGQEVAAQCAAWMEAAAKTPWKETFSSTLEGLARILSGKEAA